MIIPRMQQKIHQPLAMKPEKIRVMQTMSCRKHAANMAIRIPLNIAGLAGMHKAVAKMHKSVTTSTPIERSTEPGVRQAVSPPKMKPIEIVNMKSNMQLMGTECLRFREHNKAQMVMMYTINEVIWQPIDQQKTPKEFIQPKLRPSQFCQETTGDPCSHVTVPAFKFTETGEVSIAAPNMIMNEKNNCAETIPRTLRTNPICSESYPFNSKGAAPAKSPGTDVGYASFTTGQ